MRRFICAALAALYLTIPALAVETLPEGARPLVHSRPRLPLPVARMAGAHGTVRPDALDEREGLFAGQRGRGGILRQDEDRGGLPREVGGTHPQRGARLGR